MVLFLQKPVLHHVFLHDFNGVSAVLGANVGPAILILSVAPQQFFSTQNYNLKAISSGVIPQISQMINLI